MKQNKINRIVPSKQIVIKNVDERNLLSKNERYLIKKYERDLLSMSGSESSSNNNRNYNIVNGSLIYKVSGSYISFFTTSSYEPVCPSVGYSIKRLNEMKDNDREKYYRDDDEIICEKIVKQKSNGYNNEYLIEASTNHSSSNHKYLKIWKYYWTDDEGWKPTKSGLVIPIKDAKSFIKELHNYFNS